MNERECWYRRVDGGPYSSDRVARRREYYPHMLYPAARYAVDVTIVVSTNNNSRIRKDNTCKLLGRAGDEYDFEPMRFDPAVDLVATARSHGADA